MSTLNTFLVLAVLTSFSIHANAKLRHTSSASFEAYILKAMPNNAFVKGSQGTIAMKKMMSLHKEVMKKGKCNPNVCFMLNAGNNVSKKAYRMQKEFVELVAALASIDPEASFASVQYGLRFSPISYATKDANDFLLTVDETMLQRSRRMDLPWRRIRRKLRRSFVRSLRFCKRNTRVYPMGARKIVFIGNGFGGYEDRAWRATRRFVARRGSICAIGVGRTNRRVLNFITRSPKNVLTIKQYFELLDILDETVRNVCDM